MIQRVSGIAHPNRNFSHPKFSASEFFDLKHRRKFIANSNLYQNRNNCDSDVYKIKHLEGVFSKKNHCTWNFCSNNIPEWCLKFKIKSLWWRRILADKSWWALSGSPLYCFHFSKMYHATASNPRNPIQVQNLWSNP